MSFSDEDLKRLKAEFEPYDMGDPRILTGSDWEGLIARLEAAEKVCVGIETICNKHDLHGQAEIDIKAWRKAAGKE